ncbi:alpha/beta fold hydrolase [Brevundimonas goettingensis]|uniref:Alpha/beta hydrolase n=1 Tax=Brevundimonas goettingensis TaxID=2774190 RepID=A0A975C4E5_9CAUL|nr:alpha/beta hydrolase [Brevundimonas goettingensis]QTC92879.1 alpha/beta hydrolase [Brevundimonas goettingensis]
MPLIPLLKLVFGLLSLLILGTAVWLFWTWWGGYLIPADDGVGLVFVRDTWRLWTGLGLLAFSFMGRPLVTVLLARSDTDPSTARREDGVFIDGVDASLYVERRGAGSGLPLVLTHGWGLDSTIWDYASRALGARHPLVVWDLPGLGRSKVKPSGVTLPAFAEDLRRVVMSSSDGRVVLVGHSIGGMTIQTLVRDRPDFVRDRVAGVVLINTTYTNPLRTMIVSRLLRALQKPVLEPVFHVMAWLQPLFWLGAWQGYLSGSAHMANRLGFGRYVTRSQLEHTTLLATRNPPGVQARGNLAMFHWDATGALRDLGVPLLVLGGEVDIVTRPDASKVMAAETPEAALEMIDGVNHMGFLERADSYHLAIETFVASLPAPVDLQPPGLGVVTALR